MNRLIRNLAVLGAIAATAVPAFAVHLDFHFQGTLDSSNPAMKVVSAPTINLDQSSKSVASLTYQYDANPLGSGRIVFNDLTDVYFGFSGINTANSGLQAVVLNFYKDAAHTIVLNSPDKGAFSHSVTAEQGSQVQGQFVGDYNPVPEPASMAVLSVGAMGLIARRKRGAR
jgi:hypothetical protein